MSLPGSAQSLSYQALYARNYFEGTPFPPAFEALNRDQLRQLDRDILFVALCQTKSSGDRGAMVDQFMANLMAHAALAGKCYLDGELRHTDFTDLDESSWPMPKERANLADLLRSAKHYAMRVRAVSDQVCAGDAPSHAQAMSVAELFAKAVKMERGIRESRRRRQDALDQGRGIVGMLWNTKFPLTADAQVISAAENEVNALYRRPDGSPVGIRIKPLESPRDIQDTADRMGRGRDIDTYRIIQGAAKAGTFAALVTCPTNSGTDMPMGIVITHAHANQHVSIFPNDKMGSDKAARRVLTDAVYCLHEAILGAGVKPISQAEMDHYRSLVRDGVKRPSDLLSSTPKVDRVRGLDSCVPPLLAHAVPIGATHAKEGAPGTPALG